MNRRRSNRWSQIGQSMAEYTVVMAALVGGLLVANRGACPDEYEDCIEFLLTTMHDNYDGYSASISAVHEYATDYDIAEQPSGWPEDGGGDGDDDDGGNGNGEVDAPSLPVSPGSAIVGTGGTTIGSLDPSTGEVIDEGEVVGYYDSTTGTFTPLGGGADEAVVTSDVVIDEDGNILERQAVTDCDTGEVYAFGYRSEANGQFYDSLQYNEMDVSGYCTQTSYKVIANNGEEDGGRIVDGYYYAVTTTFGVSSDSMEPEGEVVYFEEYDACVVIASGWDSGLDPDDDDYYEQQIDLWENPPDGEDLQIGTLDDDYYTEQVMENGAPSAPNDCVANRVISAP